MTDDARDALLKDDATEVDGPAPPMSRKTLETLPGAASVPPPSGIPSRPSARPAPITAPPATDRADPPYANDALRPPTLPVLPEFENWTSVAAAAAVAPVKPPADVAKPLEANGPPEAEMALTPTPSQAGDWVPSSAKSDPLAARRRSRRTVKIPDDAVPQTPLPPAVVALQVPSESSAVDLAIPNGPITEPGSSPDEADLSFGPLPAADDGIAASPFAVSAPPSALEPPADSIDPPTTPIGAGKTDRPAKKISSLPPPPSFPADVAAVSSQSDDAAVIRPARIISIGSEPPPAPSNGVRAVAPPPAEAPFARQPMTAWVDLDEVGTPPPGADVHEVDAEVEARPATDAPPHDDGLEEIEPEPDRQSFESMPGEEVSVDVDLLDSPSQESAASAAPATPAKPALEKPAPLAAPTPPSAKVSAPAFGSQSIADLPKAPPPVGADAPAPKKPPPPPPPKRDRLGSIPDLGQAATPPPAAVSTPVPTPLPKRVRPWWEELFGDDFIRTMERLEPKFVKKECDFIEDRLGVERGAVILDLACGPGLHAVELSSRGYGVVGYDLSLAMLARAADEAQDRKQKINFLQGDMREMAFEEMFDAVYSWNTSFGYFDEEKNYNVLQRIHRALRLGGMLLLDVINRDYIACRQPSMVWFEGDGCVCMDEMALDSFTSRLKVKRTVMFEDGRTREVEYPIRVYALHELGKMLHEAGFKVVEVTGHPAHPGVFFGSESPRIIILAERGAVRSRTPPPGVPGATPGALPVPEPSKTPQPTMPDKGGPKSG